MKIERVQCWLLRIPFHFPLVREEQYAMANFVEIETDDGIKGHAMSTYPMRFGVREYINREAAPVVQGMDPMRTEEIRNKVLEMGGIVEDQQVGVVEDHHRERHARALAAGE